MKGFVLVPGAFRGSWTWERVVPTLRGAGHRVLTPETVTDEQIEAAGAPTLDDVVEPIVEATRAAAEEVGGPVTLAGHSLGGFLARVAAEECAEAIAELAFLDAPVPLDGERAFGFPGRDDPVPDMAPDRWADPPRVTVGGDMGVADAEWINARLRPEPIRPSLGPVRLVSASAAALPARHVFFSYTPDHMPCAVTRSRLDSTGGTYDLIEAGHDAPVTAPQEVAEWLTRG